MEQYHKPISFQPLSSNIPKSDAPRLESSKIHDFQEPALSNFPYSKIKPVNKNPLPPLFSQERKTTLTKDEMKFFNKEASNESMLKSEERVFENVLELLQKTNTDYIPSVQPSVQDFKDISGVRQAVSIPFKEQKILRTETNSSNLNKNWGEFPNAQSISLFNGESRSSLSKPTTFNQRQPTFSLTDSVEKSPGKTQNISDFSVAPMEISMINLPSVAGKSNAGEENVFALGERKKSKSMDLPTFKRIDSSKEAEKTQCEIGSHSEIKEDQEKGPSLKLEEDILKIVKIDVNPPEKKIKKMPKVRYSVPSIMNHERFNNKISLDIEKINEEDTESKKPVVKGIQRKSLDANFDEIQKKFMKSRNSKIQSIEEGKIIFFEEANLQPPSSQNTILSDIEEVEQEEKSKKAANPISKKKSNYFQKLKEKKPKKSSYFNGKQLEISENNENNEDSGNEENLKNKKKDNYFKKLNKRNNLHSKTRKIQKNDTVSNPPEKTEENSEKIEENPAEKKRNYFQKLKIKKAKAPATEKSESNSIESPENSHPTSKSRSNYFNKLNKFKKLHPKKKEGGLSINPHKTLSSNEPNKSSDKWEGYSPLLIKKKNSHAVFQASKKKKEQKPRETPLNDDSNEEYEENCENNQCVNKKEETQKKEEIRQDSKIGENIDAEEKNESLDNKGAEEDNKNAEESEVNEKKDRSDEKLETNEEKNDKKPEKLEVNEEKDDENAEKSKIIEDKEDKNAENTGVKEEKKYSKEKEDRNSEKSKTNKENTDKNPENSEDNEEKADEKSETNEKQKDKNGKKSEANEEIEEKSEVDEEKEGRKEEKSEANKEEIKIEELKKEDNKNDEKKIKFLKEKIKMTKTDKKKTLKRKDWRKLLMKNLKKRIQKSFKMKKRIQFQKRKTLLKKKRNSETK